MTPLSDRTIVATARRTQIRKTTLEIGVLQRERAVLARRFDMAEGWLARLASRSGRVPVGRVAFMPGRVGCCVLPG
jgi:hypothetical protein